MAADIAELAARLARVFEGKADAHGWYSVDMQKDARGKNLGPRGVVREPVTIETWIAHLRGDEGLGIVPIRDDNTCTWGAIDIDKYDGTVNHGALCQKIMMEAKLPWFVFQSKSGGAHIVCLVGAPVPAEDMQKKLRELVQFLGLSPKTEIFPKQSKIDAVRGDIGNWLNMPYCDYLNGNRYAVTHEGRPVSLQEFLTAAEKVLARHKSLDEYVIAPPPSAPDVDFTDGPPCLFFLTRKGFEEGTRNNGLTALAVYARKKYPGKWKTKVAEYNKTYMQPPLDDAEVTTIIASVGAKEYGYSCTSEPIASVCDKATCRLKRFGVGERQALIESITKMETDPPTWFVSVMGHRIKVDTAELVEFPKFKKRVFAATNQIPFDMKRDVWEVQVNEACLPDKLEVIPAPPESSADGVFQLLLRRYCHERQRAKHREEFLLGMNLVEHGFVWFELLRLMNFLRMEGFSEFSRRDVTVALRELGAINNQMRFGQRNRHAWGVSLDWLGPAPIAPPDREVGSGDVI